MTKILKDCPKGTEFYSPVFGNVKFLGATIVNITIEIHNNESYTILPNGHASFWGFISDEIMLLPSKDQRDWSKWKCPKSKFDPKTFQPFDKVLARHRSSQRWFNDFYSFTIKNEIATIGSGYYDVVIPYNDDTKHLVGTKEEAPEYYRYWED